MRNAKCAGTQNSMEWPYCSFLYCDIGETGRAFGTRQDEHERTVRLKKSGNSALAKHVHDEDHSVAWKKSRILCKENKWAQRK